MFSFKKRLVSLLVAVFMVTTFFSTVSFADDNLIFSCDMSACESFTGYFPTDYSAGITQVTSWRYNHKGVSGAFGKAADDYSYRVYVNDMKEQRESYFDFPSVSNLSLASGDSLVFGIKIANGILRKSSPTLSVYADNISNNNEFIKFGTDGTVYFIQKAVGKIPGYSTNKWYDIRLVITSGATNYGSLYIDGVPYAENVVVSTTGAVTKFNRLRLYYQQIGGLPVGESSDIYMDDINIWKYSSDVPSQIISATSSSEDIRINSSSVNVQTGKTVADLKATLSFGGYEATYLKDDFSAYSSDSDLIENGYIRISGNGREIFWKVFSTDLYFYADMSECQSFTGYFPTAYSSGLTQISGWRYSYQGVDGAFGKDAGDYSYRVYVNEIKEDNKDSYFETKALTDLDLKSGDTVVFSIKAAYGMIRNGGPQLGVYADNISNNNEFLKISPDGTVRFWLKDRGVIPNYRTNRWYDYRIVITSGATNYASLYIDGIPYAENVAISSTGPVTKFNRLRINYNGYGALKLGESCDSYMDDIGVWKFASVNQVENQEVNITSNSDDVIVNKHVIGVKSGKTVADLMNALELGGYSAKYLKADYTEYESADEVVSGGYVRFNLGNREVFKDIVVLDGSVTVSDVAFVSPDDKGVVTATVKVNNLSSAPQNGCLVLAYYSDGGKKLERVTLEKFSASVGIETAFPAKITVDETVTEVRAFVVPDSLNPPKADSSFTIE